MTTPELIRNVLVALVDATPFYGSLPSSDPVDVHARLPAVVFGEVAYREGPVSRDGYGGWDRPRWQFDCWAETYIGARDVAVQVQDALRASDMGMRLIGRRDLPEPDTGLHRVMLDVALWTPIETTDPQGS
jgi:hypothetical protein